MPVFVLGMPRSGTTLTEQILASHSQVRGAGELPYLQMILDGFDWRGSGLDAGQLAHLRGQYLERIANHAEGARFVVDKMPLNFRYAGFILAAMPEARVINLCRDARATCWSIFTQNFGNFGNGFADDLGDLTAYYKLYRGLMTFWGERFAGQIHDLDYEALTEDQEARTRALLNHVGLGWEDSCLEFHKLDRGVRTASRLQVRSKLYTGSSETWRRYAPHLGGFIADLDGW